MTGEDDANLVPPSAMRVSHAERDAVVEQLRDAAADGRIDLDELDARLAVALTAKTYGDLAPLTADLPTEAAVLDPGEPLTLKGGMHGVSRVGRWQVPARISARGGMGGVKLDFTRTECRLPEVEIEVHGEMAGVTVVIPDGWVADTDGVDPGVGGVKDKTTEDRLPGTPLIRFVGQGGMGGVVVRHPNLRERRKLERRRKPLG
ncbi:DUF1707 domain-containing protein [Streptomyces sp. NPDC000410]|uniref:DUF1707 SHOCT-like domain-containing protein n=1 Tax=Streptomyces sp. NPDC000410 TaxID=3154254 RepID=UPI00332EA17E